MSFMVISWITSVLCSGLGVFAVTRFLDRRRIKYAADGLSIIEKPDSIDGLSILHDGRQVERLTKSHVWLWNSGHRSIKPSDVIAANPITIGFGEGAKILSLRAVHATENAVGFCASEHQDGRWQLNFAHWEGRAGVVLEVLHTSTKVVPTIRGSVDGLQPIKSLGRIEIGSLLPNNQRRFRKWSPLAGTFLFAVGLWGISALHITPDPKSFLGLLLMLPGEFLMIVAGVGYLSSLWIPRELRRFGSTTKPTSP